MRGGQGVIAFGGRVPMKISIIICFVLLATVIFAVLILARGFTAEVARQEAMIRAALTPEARDPEEIPELMRRFAERSLAGQGGMPRAGEVGYVDDGIYAPYFRGRITSFEMLR